MLELDGTLEFDSARDEEFFAALPRRSGVFLLEIEDASADPYLARTADIRRGAERLLRAPEGLSKRLNLRGVATRIRYRATGSKFEQTIALYQHARVHFPRRYRDVIRLRPPVMLKVNLRNEYPRCYTTRRIGADEAFYFGPFASRRAADAFSEGFLDLFRIRRCQVKIRRDPEFPGCIYSEMKMCLAPCFAGCTQEEYRTETDRLMETLETRGRSFTQKLEQERESSSEALDFERAAALHKRLEKASAVLRVLPELVRRIEDLNLVILQRAAEEKTVAVFPVRAGTFAAPFFLRFGELSSQPRSVEAILRAGLEQRLESSVHVTSTLTSESGPTRRAPQEPVPSARQQRMRYGLLGGPAELAEHVALIARWFYSKPREGEIFFREADWPYRRILRACGRLLAPTSSPQNQMESPSQ